MTTSVQNSNSATSSDEVHQVVYSTPVMPVSPVFPAPTTNGPGEQQPLPQQHTTMPMPQLKIIAARYGWAEDLWAPTVLDNTTGSKDVTDICQKLVQNNRLHINPECQPQWMNSVFWPEQTLYPPVSRRISIKFQLGDGPIEIATSPNVAYERVDLLIPPGYAPVDEINHEQVTCIWSQTNPLTWAQAPQYFWPKATTSPKANFTLVPMQQPLLLNSAVGQGNQSSNINGIAAAQTAPSAPAASQGEQNMLQAVQHQHQQEQHQQQHQHTENNKENNIATDPNHSNRSSNKTTNLMISSASLKQWLYFAALAERSLCVFIPWGPFQALADTARIINKPKPEDYAFKSILGQLPSQVDVCPVKLAWIFAMFGYTDLRMSVPPSTRVERALIDDNREKGTRKKQSFRLVFFKSREEQRLVEERIHKRLLIDRSGVWFARTEAEMKGLEAFLADPTNRPEGSPKSCITLADASRNDSRSGPPKKLMTFDSSVMDVK